jgi:hypothetical protein
MSRIVVRFDHALTSDEVDKIQDQLGETEWGSSLMISKIERRAITFTSFYSIIPTKTDYLTNGFRDDLKMNVVVTRFSRLG